jgi:hypothetical protein
MELNFFGYEFKVGKQKPKLHDLGATAKKEQAWKNIKDGLDHINQYQIEYSEYRLQKLSGVSINTIKKYREQIAEYRTKYSISLFN